MEMKQQAFSGIKNLIKRIFEGESKKLIFIPYQFQI